MAKITRAYFDLDGCLTTGQFIYDEKGKRYKMFGPDDSAALTVLAAYIPVHIVSGDKRGWDIGAKRVADMGFSLEYMPSRARLEAIKTVESDLTEVAYMGDSFTDVRVACSVGFALCPNDAFPDLKKRCSYVCECNGGMRAVAEAVARILDEIGIGREELIW